MKYVNIISDLQISGKFLLEKTEVKTQRLASYLAFGDSK